MNVTAEQYHALCAVIDDAKNDDESQDTDIYAGEALIALGLKYTPFSPSETPNLSEAARWAVEVWRGGPSQHDADEFDSAMGDLERALR